MKCEECPGKCCYLKTRITTEEAERLEALGAPIIWDFGVIPWMDNRGKGCFFLKDEECTIYEDRPALCKNYYCREHDLMIEQKKRTGIDATKILEAKSA